MLATGAMAGWRIGADLNWTQEFFISSGLFSHWQVWLGVGALLYFCASRLNRYGRGGKASAP